MHFYQSFIYIYAVVLTVIYLLLTIVAYFNIKRSKVKYAQKEIDNLIAFPEIAPGISVVAPAYNEEVIIIDNVTSLLNLEYPNFEVIIVNDGSTDTTLDLLIEHFHLEEINYPYFEKVNCKEVRKIFRSTSAMFQRLTVVDKVNGGTKADAMNAGINIAEHKYFINVDVDCILAKDTLSKVMLPVLDSNVPVIAVGASMRMVNGCEVENGAITRVRPPRSPIPLFQETEYLRSYVVSKMGWSKFNMIPNVSGGFGLFDKEVVIRAGGYDGLSHAEDMDMTLRMTTHMIENNQPYAIKQIPDTCCWTEGPPTLKVLSRQRRRWGRGLLQIFVVHRKYLFNPRYGRVGMLVLPYAFVFEFLAPIIEFFGLLFMLYLLLSKQINFETFWFMILFVYLIGITISLVTIFFDIMIHKHYKTLREYFYLIFFSSLEAVIYHPLIMFFSIYGYIEFLTLKSFKWGDMTRQGFTKKSKVKGQTSLQ